MTTKNTKNEDYTDRLQTLSHKRWKEVLDVQRPYRWNLRRLKLSKTLEVGCGIGRNLKALDKQSVGIDHNKHSIEIAKKDGYIALTTENFRKSKYDKKGTYNSLLLAHVIEHMSEVNAKELLNEYKKYLVKNGRVVIICPQEAGYKSDQTHKTLFDFEKIENVLKDVGFEVVKKYSFPLPRFAGKFFKYNEFVVVSIKNLVVE